MMPWCHFSHLLWFFHYSVAFGSNKKNQVEWNPNPGNEINWREDVYGDTGSLGWDRACRSRSTVWKVSVFRVFLVRTFPHLDWIRRDTVSLRIHSKCRKIRTRRKTPNKDFFQAVKIAGSRQFGLLHYLKIFFHPWKIQRESECRNPYNHFTYQ